MDQAERLANLILTSCRGCLVYTVCSMPCVDLYKMLRQHGVSIPPNLPNPVGLGHTVHRIVKEWRENGRERLGMETRVG